MEAERQGEEWKKQEGREAGRGERRGALGIQRNQRKPTELNRQTPGRAGPGPSFSREATGMVGCMWTRQATLTHRGYLRALSSWAHPRRILKPLTSDHQVASGFRNPPWMESHQQRDHFTALSRKPPNQESLLLGT